MKKYFLFAAILFFPLLIAAQKTGNVVDRVIAVVGSEVIKESDVEQAFEQMKENGSDQLSDSLRGALFDQLMLQKLLISQAHHDSLDVTESDIANETDRRMRYFLTQFKSEKDFEVFYGESVDAFKFELHDQVRDLLYAQKMRAKITGDITVSPSEVKEYFERQPKDSLPFINSQVEIGEIVSVPPVNKDIREFTRQNLEDVRQRVIKKQLDFCDAVVTYSQDPGSNRNCGEYDNVRRGTFVPEFDAICFNMKEGEISEVFETSYGFHFVLLIERKGEEVSIKHILLTIPPAPEDLLASKSRLDSVRYLIVKDSLTFCQAAAKFSSDADTKFNCGLIINPETGTTKIDVDMLGDIDPDPQFPLTINQMKVGEISTAQPCLTKDGKQGYRLLYLKSRSEPHRANLKDDYQLIEDLALQEKQNKALDAWVRKKLANTYIRITPDYMKYNYHYPWLEFAKS
ncbi:MAG: peptidylprolyl isomerase [Bacteroidetes bacterium]|nr:peptidylprolyl isomerase [Bacteroidota bacterium]